MSTEEKYADLHIHTNYSDGTFTPQQILTLAQKVGLSCISITDHDSVSALPFFASTREIEVLPGIELTAQINDTEVHVLGYLIDYEEGWFQEKLEEIREIRIQRMRQMCKKLTQLGMPIEAEEVLDFAEHNCVGRLHLARLMVKKGFVATTREAFNLYIGDHGPAYVSRFKLTPYEAIELILKLRGIPVLAHPYTLGNQDLIPQFVKAGLKGLEVIYPEHTSNQTKHYNELAREYNLLVTGGSDCHGEAKPEVKMGTLKIPYALVEKLKEAKP